MLFYYTSVKNTTRERYLVALLRLPKKVSAYFNMNYDEIYFKKVLKNYRFPEEESSFFGLSTHI